ncbi:MAG: DUF6209 family protein [Kofleriaceae bacterium]
MRVALFGLLAACAASGTPSEGTTTSTAPLLGVDGSSDQADRSCNVVLRGIQREGNGTGGYITNGEYWVWVGTIEISNAAAAEGLTPSALYQSGSDPTWYEVETTPSTQTASLGFTRFDVMIDDHVVGPGMSSTAITSANIQVVPFIHLAAGGRLFDHNRFSGDTENYAMTYPDLAIWPDPTVCGAATGPTAANLVFDAGYTQHRDGVLAPGGNVSIEYDKSRLAQCESTMGGIPQYDITAWLQFSPGNQLVSASVRDSAPIMAVPSDARSVQVWFETTNRYGCHGYDSNNGANYEFDMAVAPQWIGNGNTVFDRDSSHHCGGGADVMSGFTFDTWTRQRAAITNTCFEVYQPGLTDHDDPDLWQKLDVEIHVETAPNVWSTYPVDFESRQGNNARYAFSWRNVDPFRSYNCPTTAVTPTSDGMYEQTTLFYYITVNGGQYRPEPGAAFAGIFVDYLHDQYRDTYCN